MMNWILFTVATCILTLPYYFNFCAAMVEDYKKISFEQGYELTHGVVRKEGIHTLFTNCYLSEEPYMRVLVAYKPLAFLIMFIPMFLIGVLRAMWEYGLKHFKLDDYIIFGKEVEYEEMGKAKEIWEGC